MMFKKYFVGFRGKFYVFFFAGKIGRVGFLRIPLRGETAVETVETVERPMARPATSFLLKAELKVC